MSRCLVVSILVGIVAGCGGAGPASQGPASTPAVTPSPTSPALLARGTFTLYEGQVEVDATGSGDSVTGTMAVTHVTGNFTVDLKCSRTTEGGVILLAGDITESASPYARKGAREVLVLKPGSQLYAGFDSEGREGGPILPAASCPALLQQAIDAGMADDLEPIEGSVEFGP